MHTTREENVALMKKPDGELIALIPKQEPTAGITLTRTWHGSQERDPRIPGKGSDWSGTPLMTVIS